MKNNGLHKPAKEETSHEETLLGETLLGETLLGETLLGETLLGEPILDQPSREEKVYMVLAAVPSGTVVTYGQVAEMAGLPRAARMVGRILGKLPKGTELPWHRVVNTAGKISLPEDSPGFKTQKARLQEEGVALNNNRVSLKKFNWQP